MDNNTKIIVVAPDGDGLNDFYDILNREIGYGKDQIDTRLFEKVKENKDNIDVRLLNILKDISQEKLEVDTIIAIVSGGGFERIDDKINPLSTKAAAFYSFDAVRLIENLKKSGVIFVSGIGHSCDSFPVSHACSYIKITPTDAANQIIKLIRPKQQNIITNIVVEKKSSFIDFIKSITTRQLQQVVVSVMFLSWLFVVPYNYNNQNYSHFTMLTHIGEQDGKIISRLEKSATLKPLGEILPDDLSAKLPALKDIFKKKSLEGIGDVNIDLDKVINIKKDLITFRGPSLFEVLQSVFMIFALMGAAWFGVGKFYKSN